MDIQYARLGDIGSAYSMGLQNAQARQNMANMRFEQEQKRRAIEEQRQVEMEVSAGLQKFGSAREALRNVQSSAMASKIYPYLVQMAKQEQDFEAYEMDKEAVKRGLAEKDALLRQQNIKDSAFMLSQEQDPLKRSIGLKMLRGQSPMNEFESSIPEDASLDQLRAFALGPENYLKYQKEDQALKEEAKQKPLIKVSENGEFVPVDPYTGKHFYTGKTVKTKEGQPNYVVVGDNVYQSTKQGLVPASTVSGDPVTKPKKYTEGQYLAATFGTRAEDANRQLQALIDKGFDRTSAKAGAFSYAPNFLKGDNLQQQEQAERNFINALLRRESGAVIGPDEFANAEKQYFPRVGDGPETLRNKKRNREVVIKSLISESQGAYDEVKKQLNPQTNKDPLGLGL